MRILQEAAESTSVWVTSQVVDEAELNRRVRGALRPRDPESVRVLSVPEETLREIVPTELPDHVCGWIGAGYVHERLLELSPAPDFVFCLDPWAAMLIGRSRALLPKAKWTYVKDLPARENEREYWDAANEWLDGLGFDQVLPVEALARSTSGQVLKRPGSWELRSLGASPGKQVAVRCSSVLRLRVFAEALLRQEKLPSALLIASKEPSIELARFAACLRLSYPGLRVDIVSDAPPDALDDGLILPADFLRRSGTPGCRVPLDPRVAAQILIGNLNPFPVYAQLRAAHRAGPDDLLVFPELA
jgi:hypothetical protein